MKPAIRTMFLVLMVLVLAVLVAIQHALGAQSDLIVKELKYCRLYADVALVAASFAVKVKSKAELKAGVDPIYIFQGQAVDISDRIVLIAWTMKPEPREWALKLMVACHEKRGDLRQFLAEPL